ncbi:MAG: hypothetical protein HYX94_03430, partial [Chloroflexi bacterium]|nr:hypothetical protein [Chloroflexota bacterium]
ARKFGDGGTGPSPLSPVPHPDGQTDETGNILGTYLHGLFHNASFRRRLLDELRRRKGLPPLGRVVAFSKDREYDKLAAVVRDNIDTEAVYRMIGLR